MAWKLLYKIIDTEDKKKQLAAKRRELSKAKERIAEIDTLIQKICDTRAAPGHLPYGGCPKGGSLLLWLLTQTGRRTGHGR